MPTQQQFVVIAVAIVVLLSGCAGWGTDGPDDDLDESEPAQADASNESGAGDGADATASANDSDNDVTASDNESESESQNQTESGDSTDSGTEKRESQRSTSEGSSDETPTYEDDQTGDSDSSGDSMTDDGTDEKKSDEKKSDGSADENESDTHTLTVTVTKDDEPVENASVHATGPVLDNGAAHEPSADTNADGQAVLDVYEGTYTVQATGDSGTNTTEIDVTGDTEITIDIAAESDRGGNKEHTLSVTVVDPDEQPIEGATVELFTYPDGEKVATATTDENGVAEFSVPRGGYEIAANSEPYTDYGTHLITVGDSDASYTVELAHPPDNDGSDNDTDSDDSGANDGAKEDDQKNNTDGKNGDENGADGGENETNGEPATHTLTVTVTDPNDDPVVGEEVHIVTYDGGADVASGTTDENGQVQFELEDGDYEVAVSAPENDLYQSSNNRLVTIDGEDVTFPVQLQSAGGDDPETHTLTVTIIDRTNAGPMQGTATVNGETKAVPGDQGAQFEVENGTYTVTGETSEDGWHVGTERVTIDGDDAKVALPANPIQTVTVETSEPGVDVTLTGPAADEKETKTTGDDGRVEFEALPGNYSVTADGYESTDVTVPGAHDPAPVELTPTTTSTPTHTLTITNAGTAPVEIMEDAPPDEDPKTTTHEPINGVVETEVAEGTYHISTDDRVNTLAGVHVDSDTEITLQDPDPEPLMIEVVDATTGEGITGAEINGLCHLWYSGGDEYITGTTGSDGVADAQPGVSPTICETTISADGYKNEHVRISVPEDDGLVIELQPVDEASDGAATDSSNTSNATMMATAAA